MARVRDYLWNPLMGLLSTDKSGLFVVELELGAFRRHDRKAYAEPLPEQRQGMLFLISTGRLRWRALRPPNPMAWP